MVVGFTQPVTKMGTRNLPECEGQPVCKDEYLFALSEPTVYKIWDPRRTNTLYTSTA
jgi:hypothetical protein